MAFARERSIAFGSHRGDGCPIYTVEPDGSSLRKLTNDTYVNPRPASDPDGTKIAFGAGNIWVMGADGFNLRKLSPNRSDASNADSSPTWPPSGDEVAFMSGGPPNQFHTDVYMMDVDGSNQTNLTDSPNIDEISPDFPPDGSRMCIYRTGPTCPIPTFSTG